MQELLIAMTPERLGALQRRGLLRHGVMTTKALRYRRKLMRQRAKEKRA
jgi:hypothetical protein